MTLNPKLDPTCVLCLPWGEAGGSTAYDQSQYGNNGTIYGAVRTSGRPRWALSFDGVYDYVQVPFSESINLKTEATIVGWYYFTGTQRGISTNKEEHYRGFDYYPDTNIFEWDIGNGIGWLRIIRFTPSITIPNRWVHVASVINWVEGWGKLYFNGKLENTCTFAPGAVSGYQRDLFVGTFSPYRNFFTGLVGEVRIYSRALSDKEIYTLYVYGLESLRKAPPLRGGGLEW